MTTRADFGRTRLVETAANVNPTALLSIFLVMMIAWYVPGGRAHIANAWQDLYYYLWRMWTAVRYPDWRESAWIRAVMLFGVIGLLVVIFRNEQLSQILSIVLFFWAIRRIAYRGN